MKINKKFIASATSAALVASAIVPVASAASFSDIENNTHKEAILALAEAGIISGYTDGTFKPNAQVTRGNVTKLLGKWLVSEGYDIPADYNTVERFTDVPVTHADQELVKYAALVKDAEVFNGSNGKLMQANNMSREQMAVVLVRAIKTVYGIDLIADYKAANFESEITDFDQAIADYHESITALEFAGLTTQKTFNPKGTVTRGQFASFLNRAIEYAAKQEVAETVEVEAVTAVNGTLTVTLKEKAEKVDVKDFTVTQAINGGEAKEVTPSKAELSEDGLTVTLKVAEVAAQETTSQSVVYTVNEVAAPAFVVEASTPAVNSVTAINGKQLEVKFSVAVEEDSVIQNDDTLVDGVFKFEKVAATSPAINLDNAEATLSEDGRTLTITFTGNEYAAGDYVFSVAKNKVQTTNKNKIEYIPAYTSSTISVKDTVAPTLVSTAKINATQYKLTFSKPVSGLGTISAKYADGSDLGTATVTHAAESTDADNNAIIVTLTNTTVNKDVNVQIVGITDYNGNIVAPNPVTFTATAGAKDGVAPTFTVNVESASTLTVKFSEEIQAFPKSEFKIDTVALTSNDVVVQDKTDKTKFTVTLATPLTAGFHNITVDATKFKDLSGEDNVAHASTIQVKADQVAPLLSSSKVVKERDGKEYLYVTFDKDVQLDKFGAAITNAMTGKAVENYVTDNSITFKTTEAFTSVDGSKKEFKLALSSITDGSDNALKDGVTYTIDLPASVVKTLTGTPSETQKGAITFTKGVDSSTTTLTVEEVKTNQASLTGGTSGKDASLKNNQVTVKFSQAVDGASATNASNYIIDGAVVKSAELGTDKVTVTLTLEDNKTTYSGARYLTINNVTTASGVALEETFKKAITLNENIAPTVTGVAIKSISGSTATVELTFSEAVNTNTTTDLSVFVDGLVDSGVTVATTAAGNTNTFSKTLTATITLDNVSKLTANTITLKANGSSNTIVDAAGNLADIGTVTVK